MRHLLKPLASVALAASLAVLFGVSVIGQPTPGVGVFSSIRVNNVGIVSTNGKIPALTSAYLDNVSGAAVTFPFVTPAFSGANYTASGTMTWTVESGDIGVNNYSLDGSKMLWTVGLNSTTVAGVTSSELRITIPGSIVPTVSSSGACAATDNSVEVPAYYTAAGGTSYVSIYRGINAGGWNIAAVNTTSIRCTVLIIR